MGPLVTINMRRPHDGIVEEQSNSMAPCNAGRWSEKAATINSPGRARTYAHTVLKASEELTHTDIQTDREVMILVRNVMLARSVAAWREQLTETDFDRLRVLP